MVELNGYAVDVNAKDQRIDNDDSISHPFHVSIIRCKGHLGRNEITISIYSVCLVINNMDYYVDIAEKNIDYPEDDPVNYFSIPDLLTMGMN